jgi:hypothetical protein
MKHLRIASIFIITLSAFTQVHAINVNPKYIELTMPVGSSYTGQVEIVNESTDSETITIGFEDKTTGPNKGMAWLTSQSRTVEMKPGQTNLVPFFITIPEGAKGELRGRMGFLKENLEPTTGPFGIKMKTSISIYAIVQGTEEFGGHIAGFRLSPGSKNKYELRVFNSGNVHHRAVGKGQIWEYDSTNLVSTFLINKDKAPFYPGETNLLTGLLDSDLKPGRYSVDLRLPFPDGKNVLRDQYEITVK